MPNSQDPAEDFARFFDARGWQPFEFQQHVWDAYAAEKSGLLHAPTGQGKTLAVWLGPLSERLSKAPPQTAPPFSVLWITPLRALASDTLRALQEPLEALGLNWPVAARTGDTTANQRRKLKEKLPFALVTTPESLSLMLSYEDFRDKCRHLQAVIVDEWHELLGSKRGVQTQLCLARLRHWQPELRIWGLSATLGNLDQATRALLGSAADHAALVAGKDDKTTEIQTLIPSDIENFPWSGHLGTRSLQAVINELEKAGSSLVFTNTRAQTEIWFEKLLQSRPDWSDRIAMHHGSVDREERRRVEAGLRSGQLRCVVCTSSLDLGVDFSPVEQVIQVGSPKGIARLMQRAGRSGHQPGAPSRLLCVPTNALELVEFAAARRAMEARCIESRNSPENPLDVLVQHLATLAIATGIHPDESLAEIRSAHAYRHLSQSEWDWAIAFLSSGGKALSAYPQFQRAEETPDGWLRISDKKLIQNHRMSIGTISSEASITVKFRGGKSLGSVEEGFISRLRPGDQFLFAGRRLRLLRFRDQTATVEAAKRSKAGQVATWTGTQMPLSSELGHAVSERLQETRPESPEMRAFAPIRKIQAQASRIPSDQQLLIEQTRTREGEHAFLFPFAGRLAHQGIASLLAYRISQDSGEDVHLTVNDYGIGLTSRGGLFHDETEWRELLSPDALLDDLLDCLNTAELAKRQFREIAQIAGLVMQGFPGRRKNTRQLQISSNLLFEVFTRYDPDNLLLEQARQEILEGQLELSRLNQCLSQLQHRPMALLELAKLSPMAFPLWAERLQATLPAGDYQTRLEKMLADLS